MQKKVKRRRRRGEKKRIAEEKKRRARARVIVAEREKIVFPQASKEWPTAARLSRGEVRFAEICKTEQLRAERVRVGKSEELRSWKVF